MKSSQTPNWVVTDHAVVRYLQRVCGIDFDAVREEILDDDVKAAIALKASAYKKDGITYRFENGRIITVLTDGAYQ